MIWGSDDLESTGKDMMTKRNIVELRQFIRSTLSEAPRRSKKDVKDTTEPETRVVDKMPSKPVIDDIPRPEAPLGRKQGTRDIMAQAPEDDFDDVDIDRVGPDVDNFRGGQFDIEPEDAPEGFDFDAAFQDALQMGVAARGMHWQENDTNIGIETPTQHSFPTNAPAPVGHGRAVERPRRYATNKAEAMSILMDEIYAPGMQLGRQLLPAVYAELQRLMMQDERIFKKTFAAALAKIREVENAWFAGILGETPTQPGQLPSGDPAEHEMLDRLLYVMDKYFTAVFKRASRNAGNLIDRMEKMKARIGTEAFKKAFQDALIETRNIEDQAFAQFLGGMYRLPPRR